MLTYQPRAFLADDFEPECPQRCGTGRADAERTTDTQPSIAVLPFADMSAGKDHEWFSDGLSEEIINVLAHLPGLKVTARTSAFAFRGKDQDVRQIAEALGVRAVLEGSVRRAGSRIRVTAQLINAEDGYHLWSERYDREMADVFAIQALALAAVLDYDWPAARTHFGLAMACDPIPPLVRYYYACFFLAPLGRMKEVQEETGRALQ